MSRFSAGLAKLKGEATPTAPMEAPPIQLTPPTQTERTTPLPPSRRGKKVIAAYFDPAVRKQLAILAAQEERSQADLLAEAMNLLFEKHGLSPIAKA